MIDAILFDLDGTLQDSEVLYVEAWKQMYREKGCEVSQAMALDLVYGLANGEIYAGFEQLFPGAYADLVDALEGLKKHFAIVKDGRDVSIHSSIALLRDLSRNRPICIVSGSERQHIAEAVAQLELGDNIEFFIGREDYAHGKPDPACYLLAAERLGVAPWRCLVFEDSTVGVGAAKRAGMHCVALSRPGTPQQDISAADLVLADLADFELGRWELG